VTHDAPAVSDAATLRTTLEAEYADALDRLGSPDLLRALSGGPPDPDALLRAAADSEHAARGTFREWAAAAADDDLRDLFAAVARQEADHRCRVCDRIGRPYDPADGGPMHAYLRGRDHPIDRVAGGLVGRTLVSLRTHARLIAFFDGRDEAAAALFRRLREETGDCLADGLATLDRRCGDGDWERARAVAGYVIRLAEDDLQDALVAVESDRPSR
jgi:hypothetical protein